jgi:hypothetical protein
MPANNGCRIDDRERIQNTRRDPIQADEDQAIEVAEDRALRRPSVQYVQLKAQSQVLCSKRCSRPEQPDEHPPDQIEQVPHGPIHRPIRSLTPSGRDLRQRHPAIVDREVFDRVQAMLAERSVSRTVKRGNSPHLLTGLIFDDRGNPMSPTHANKKGVRYRYYTSHALLQRRKENAGSVSRVCAPEVEALFRDALRREDSAVDEVSEKDLVAQHVSRMIIRRDRIEVDLQRDPDREEVGSASKLVIPFSPTASAQKGITREAPNNGRIDARAREKLLNAIRRASR